MTSIVYDGIVSGLRLPDIEGLLLNSGLFSDGKIPSRNQIANKINHVSRLYSLRPKVERPNKSLSTDFNSEVSNSKGRKRSRGRPRVPNNRYVPFIK